MATPAAERDGRGAECHRGEAALKAGANVLGPVDTAGDVAQRVRHRGSSRPGPRRFSAANEILSVFVTAPASISPSARLLGDTVAWAVTASSIRSIPAPWRWTFSSKPSAGTPHHNAGRAVFCSRRSTSFGPGARPAFEQQRHRPGDVRRRHRGAADVSVSALFERQRRPDGPARRAEVGLEAEIGRQAVGREAGDDAAVRLRLTRDGRRPRHRHRTAREAPVDQDALGVGDADDRNRDWRRPPRSAR